MIRYPFVLLYSTPGASAPGALVVPDQKTNESRKNRLYPVSAIRQTGPIPTMEKQMRGVTKDNLADNAVAQVMQLFRKEFPDKAKEWSDAVHRRAAELLYEPIYLHGFNNVEALAAFVMDEIRQVHRSGMARPTARQLDMRRRNAWKALEASHTTALARQETSHE